MSLKSEVKPPMGKVVRQIIKIDEELCNGCGLCVTACAEGALQIVDGKARIVSEQYCDGLGACLGECPQGAISFETREAEEFDEEATLKHLEEGGISTDMHQVHTVEQALESKHTHYDNRVGFVCPSMRVIDRTNEAPNNDNIAETSFTASELRQWPVKLYLVNPTASYFQDANLLVCADCVPFVLGSFHPQLLRGKIVVAGCPKFDESELYLEKLTQIFRQNNIRSITVAMMEVPCCSGLLRLLEAAVSASNKSIPVESIVVSLDGTILKKTAENQPVANKVTS